MVEGAKQNMNAHAFYGEGDGYPKDSFCKFHPLQKSNLHEEFLEVACQDSGWEPYLTYNNFCSKPYGLDNKNHHLFVVNDKLKI